MRQGEAQTVQQVRVPSGERLATAPVQNPACREATNYMVPGGRRYQAATQVKGLSPEMSSVIEADMLHIHGRQHSYIRNGEGGAALSGSETVAWYQRGCLGTWEIQGVVP